MTTPPGNPTQMQQLIDAVTAMKTSIDMQATLMSGQGATSVFAQMDHRLQQLVTYVQNNGGMPGHQGGGGAHGGFTAPGSQTLRPPPAWGGSYPGGMGLSQVRMNAASMLDQIAGSGAGDAYIPHGTNAAGQKTYNHLRNGQSLGIKTVGTGQGQIAPTAMAAAAGRSAVANVANHAGGTSALGLIKKIPYVGTAVKVVEGVANTVYGAAGAITDQINAGRNYQAIYGGGFWGGQGQRLNKGLSQIGNKLTGGMEDADYEAAYDSISAMGYKGRQRDDKLAFVSNVYRSTGAKSNETLPFVDMVAKGAGINLQNLTEVLRGVSDAAREAGQSGVVFRKELAKQTAVNWQGGYGGNAAVGMAVAQQGATAGLGRSFAQMGFDTASESAQQVLAATSGYASVGQYEIAVRKDRKVGERAQDKLLTQNLDALMPNLKRWVQEEIKKGRKPPKNDNDVYKSWLPRIPVEIQKTDLTSPDAVRAIMAASGVTGTDTMTDDAVWAYCILHYAGQASITKHNKTTKHEKGGDVSHKRKSGPAARTGDFLNPKDDASKQHPGGKGSHSDKTAKPASSSDSSSSDSGSADLTGGSINLQGGAKNLKPSKGGDTVTHKVQIELSPKAAKLLQHLDDPSDPKVESGAKSNSPTQQGAR